MEREVTIAELRELHIEHSFNARLTIHALFRKLKYIREDLNLPFGASTSCDTTISNLSIIQGLSDDQAVLDQVYTCFFDVDRKYDAVFSDEFYVGFWDAWGDIRDIGRSRFVDTRWLDAIQVIENCRLDVYSPLRHEKRSLVLSCNKDRTDRETTEGALHGSFNQSALYDRSNAIARDELFTGGICPSKSERNASKDRTTKTGCTGENGSSIGPGDLRRLYGLARSIGHARYVPPTRKSLSVNAIGVVSRVKVSSKHVSGNQISMIGVSPDLSVHKDSDVLAGLPQLDNILPQPPQLCGERSTLSDLSASFNRLGRPRLQSSPLKRSAADADYENIDDTCDRIVAAYGYSTDSQPPYLDMGTALIISCS